MVYKFFDKKTKGSGVTTLTKNLLLNLYLKTNNQLMNFINPLLNFFKKRTVNSAFKDNIWDADLANMQLISKSNKGFSFYYMLLIFIANMLGLFLQKIRKV